MYISNEKHRHTLCIIYRRSTGITHPREGHYLTVANYLRGQISYMHINLQVYFSYLNFPLKIVTKGIDSYPHGFLSIVEYLF